MKVLKNLLIFAVLFSVFSIWSMDMEEINIEGFEEVGAHVQNKETKKRGRGLVDSSGDQGEGDFQNSMKKLIFSLGNDSSEKIYDQIQSVYALSQDPNNDFAAKQQFFDKVTHLQKQYNIAHGNEMAGEKGDIVVPIQQFYFTNNENK